MWNNFLKTIAIFFIATGFFSCRYSQPFLKIQLNKKIEIDSSDFEKTISRRYLYFRISRNGVLGECRKYKTYDSSGTLREKRISKISTTWTDTYSTSLSKTKLFDKNGKLKSKSREIIKDKGWSGTGKWKEKTITFDSTHRRIVTIIDHTVKSTKVPFKDRFLRHKVKSVF